jgi:hypothetical protein
VGGCVGILSAHCTLWSGKWNEVTEYGIEMCNAIIYAGMEY